MKVVTLKHVLSEIVNEESYTGDSCEKCGRYRVELITLSSGNKYHICEKCRYIKEQKRYCDDSDFSYDVYSNGKMYLNEVLSTVREMTESELWLALVNANKRKDKSE